jgi:hypothetical protein
MAQFGTFATSFVWKAFLFPALLVFVASLLKAFAGTTAFFGAISSPGCVC